MTVASTIDRNSISFVQADRPTESDSRGWTAKRIVVGLLLGALVIAFAGALGLGVLREAAGTNSYALMADAWLHGRLYVDRCFDLDCAYFGGHTYIIFPPLPAVIVLPFVALFGPDFHAFVPLSILAFAVTGFIWWRIAATLTETRDLAILLVLVVLFATPLYFVTLRGDHVWFFAQSWGFLFSSAALYCALVRRNALLAGLFVALAFLCRQMAILYLPFVYILLLRDDPLFRIDGAAIKRAASLVAFPLIAVAIYLAYNYVRFGSPMDTGYPYIFVDPTHTGQATHVGNFITQRGRDLGVFSPDYFLFNVVYMFFAGPHIDFAGRYMTQLAGFDANGAALFLVSPVLLLGFLARWNRSFWFGFATCAFILGVTLFYHSNGFSQYSAQRYALDWLPILLVFVARGMKPSFAGALSIFTFYAMAVTLGMIVVGGLLAA